MSEHPLEEALQRAEAYRNPVTAEQRARDLLEEAGVADAQSWTAGDLVIFANLIIDADKWRQRHFRYWCEHCDEAHVYRGPRR